MEAERDRKPVIAVKNNSVEPPRRVGYTSGMSDGHLAERAARAKKIVAAPQSYKICEGCESIVARRVATCPNSHGYRFNMDEAEIIAQAKLLASRPQTSVTESDML
jgi:hypothetical protein